MSSGIEPPPSIKKPLVVRPTKNQKSDSHFFSRNPEKSGTEKNRNFNYPKHCLTVSESVEEAQRCLNCLNAPCRLGCPTQVDVPSLNYATGQGNFYVAAKTLLTHNPLGWTCGMLCPTSHACAGSCTLFESKYGSIDINGIHTAVMDTFLNTNLVQIRDPNVIEKSYFNEKIGLIGAGPASLSAATYLARIGYNNITIFEKRSFAGGTPAIEIPEFRIPFYITRFETKLVEDLGVKFEYNKQLGKDFNIEDLQNQGYKGIFVGVGCPEANVVKQFREASKICTNVYNSKDFLTLVCNASKPHMQKHESHAVGDPANPNPLPDFTGNVIVVGAGDVAADCCQAAFRCGASFVSLVFRRGIIDMRMNEDESDGLKREKVELIGCCSPKEVIYNKDTKKASAVVCEVMRKVPGTEKYVPDNGQLRTIEFDHCVTAFGSQIGADIYKPLVINQKTWVLDVNPSTNQALGANAVPLPGVYAGGDCIGSGTIVEGVNDGKVAAWNLHRYLASLHGDTSIPEQPTKVPAFLTPVDLVDTSVKLGNLYFNNPFGLSSGPSTENTQMIGRAFAAGFSYAITKTIQLDAELLPNVSPRIAAASKGSYVNLELNSERTLAYWLDNLPTLKERFPKNVVIASILSKSGNLAAWVELALKVAGTGVAGLQLNIPYVGGGKTYPAVVQETVSAVVDALKGRSLSTAVFVKIGYYGNGDVVSLAQAAKAGGASGVVAIDTVPGLSGVKSDGTFVPTVGALTAYSGGANATSSSIGGLSGAAIRPFALASVIEISKALPGFPIIASGGIENSKTAFEFIQSGASLISLVSAVFSTGFDLINAELNGGLKYLVYQHSKEVSNKTHTISNVPDHFDAFTSCEVTKRRGQRISFGGFRAKDVKVEIEDILKLPLPYPAALDYIEKSVINNPNHVSVSSSSSSSSSTSSSSGGVSITSVVGNALPHIIPFNELNPSLRVVSVIDTTLCLNCGRCQRACFDSGYACIVFDKTTRLPRVTQMCHGCGLCEAVCPSGCIKMVPKK